jgi:hypothetical protein
MHAPLALPPIQVGGEWGQCGKREVASSQDEDRFPVPQKFKRLILLPLLLPSTVSPTNLSLPTTLES